MWWRGRKLQKRYDPQTWADFQGWAQKTEVEPGTTVWQWMGGKKTTPKPVAPKKKAAKKAPAKKKTSPKPAPKKPAKKTPTKKPPAPKAAAPQSPPKRTMATIETALSGHAKQWSQLTQEREALRAARNTAWQAKQWSESVQHSADLAAKEAEINQWLEPVRDLVSIPPTERGQVVVSKATKSVTAIVEQGSRLTERYTHASLMPRIEAEYHAGRARHSKGVIGVNAKTSPSVVMHEITHATEQQTGSVLAKSLAFLKKRAGNEPLQSLRKLTGIKEYKAHEMAFEDEFAKRGGSHYMGKTYGGRATELLTMGVERLHRDPLEFMTNDQEYFRFVVETLQML